MGHYRQWLHYREIDQLLRSQLAVAEHEMQQIQVQVEMLEKQDFSTENTIFQALTKELHQEQYTQSGKLAGMQKHVPTETAKEQAGAIPPAKTLEETSSIISPALLAWSQLPNLDTQVVQKSEANGFAHQQETPPPPTDKHSSLIDKSPSTNTQDSSDTQTQIPTVDDLKLPATHPMDQQNAHIDYVVQRWFERWGKQSTDAKRSQEDQKG
jgi:hypothetical protein